jgi:tetratricopeptide (TPR) repeat protein
LADYSLNLKANIDTSQILRQLQTIEQKGLKVNIDKGSLSSVQTSLNNINKNLQSTYRILVQISGKISDLPKNIKIVDASANSTNKTLKQTSQTMGDIFEKMSKFYTVSQVIGLATSATRGWYEAVADLDSALTEFKKVSDLSGDSLEAYTDKLSALGKETARTKTEMVEAATIFKRSGYSEDDAAILAQMATLYQNVADSEVSAADAASFIIASMKAFNITEASDAIEILDSLNSIANNFAISSSDIATAMPKVSATLAQAGNTMQQTMALISAGAEIMPNQA